MDTRTIEQTVTFLMSCTDFYDTMMDPAKHQSLSGEPAVISAEPGGVFTVWGQHLSGFNLVLKPGVKIVQAWRASDWPPDLYSIVTFDLRSSADPRDAGDRCELRFTQIGIPTDRYDSISEGWIAFYWTPIRELREHGHLSNESLERIRAAREYIQAGGA